MECLLTRGKCLRDERGLKGLVGGDAAQRYSIKRSEGIPPHYCLVCQSLLLAVLAPPSGSSCVAVLVGIHYEPRALHQQDPGRQQPTSQRLGDKGA
ncbi:hypothetical protein E2C01_099872 [Portunus trituberculatus]|uniref:Uncharacterized protein n=1 Tax=Portunus trituberculatus TaxID=210409 RepID=A0A5B7KFZ1_PORTR|nr:hypothetical protein [Portunus trituberculatus]